MWLSPADDADVPATLTVRELAAGGKILVTILLRPNDDPKPAINARSGLDHNSAHPVDCEIVGPHSGPYGLAPRT